jgi:hypothetical protein
MTEEEWDACADPHGMLLAWQRSLPREQLHGLPRIRTPDRKLRLFAVALGRCLQELFKHEWHRMALDATEEVADDESREGEVRGALCQLHDDMNRPRHLDNPDLDKAVWLAAIPHEFWEATTHLMYNVRSALRTAWGNHTPPVPTQADIVREIFENPFRPVTFDTAWRTSDVMLLANGIYADRAFDRMPILADALQDAGCDNEDILGHCRDASATHVRGCWALDLVLGKE